MTGDFKLQWLDNGIRDYMKWVKQKADNQNSLYVLEISFDWRIHTARRKCGQFYALLLLICPSIWMEPVHWRLSLLMMIHPNYFIRLLLHLPKCMKKIYITHWNSCFIWKNSGLLTKGTIQRHYHINKGKGNMSISISILYHLQINNISQGTMSSWQNKLNSIVASLEISHCLF